MTTQAPDVTVQTKLPDPVYPMVVHVISNPMFPPEVDPKTGHPHKEEPVHWVISKEHPFVQNFKVMRMFIRAGCVEVYSVSSDGKVGMRDVMFAQNVRLTQESMPLDIFVEELADAEAGEEDPDPDPDPGLAPAVNGQNPS